MLTPAHDHLDDRNLILSVVKEDDVDVVHFKESSMVQKVKFHLRPVTSGSRLENGK